MAPREATGTFPDQFLTFDYDASMPMGIPPPHDPLPLGPVATMMDATEEDVTPPPDAMDHVGNTTSSDASRPPANTQVDPLSIDPTAQQSAPWDAHSNRQHQFPTPQPPAASVSFGSTVTTVIATQGGTSAVATSRHGQHPANANTHTLSAAPSNATQYSFLTQASPAVPRSQLFHQVSQV